MHVPSVFANLHPVAPGLFRCAQPFTAGHWRALMRRYGFQTIINLRGANPKAAWYRDEVALCAARGATHVDVMLSSKRLPSREALKDVLYALDVNQKPIAIKCSGGSDRTGLIAGLYLVDREGPQALDKARAHLRLFPYIHAPKPQQRWIKAFWDFFKATHEGRPLRLWLEKTYSEQAFADYLDAHGGKDFWRREWR